MKRMAIVLFFMLPAPALFPSKVYHLSLEGITGKSKAIVIGEIVGIRDNSSRCEKSLQVSFRIISVLKGPLKSATGIHYDSIPISIEGCPSVHFERYPGNIWFTAKDKGKRALFFYYYDTDSSRYCDDIGKEKEVRRLLMKR